MKKLVSDLITVIIDNISSVILILIILFSIGINITSIRSCSNQQRINENNILAMTDSISYYKSKQYLKVVKDFRISTKFDNFFIENLFEYEKMIERQTN